MIKQEETQAISASKTENISEVSEEGDSLNKIHRVNDMQKMNAHELGDGDFKILPDMSIGTDFQE